MNGRRPRLRFEGHRSTPNCPNRPEKSIWEFPQRWRTNGMRLFRNLIYRNRLSCPKEHRQNRTFAPEQNPPSRNPCAYIWGQSRDRVVPTHNPFIRLDSVIFLSYNKPFPLTCVPYVWMLTSETFLRLSISSLKLPERLPWLVYAAFVVEGVSCSACSASMVAMT